MIKLPRFHRLPQAGGFLLEKNMENKIWFDEMHVLTGPEIRERIEMTDRLEKQIKAILDWYAEFDMDFVLWNLLYNKFYVTYITIVREYAKNATYVELYSGEFAMNMMNSSRNHIGEEYIYSFERARNAARNEVNKVMNKKRHDDYLVTGNWQHQWITILDGKERDSHAMAAFQIQPINAPFIVGGYRMMHPGDTSLGAPAEEIINCRCMEKFL